MPAPSDTAASTFLTNTSPKTAAVDVATNNLIVVCGIARNAGCTFGTPSDGINTYGLEATIGSSGTLGKAAMWTAVAASTTTITVSLSGTGTPAYGVAVLVFQNAEAGAVGTGNATTGGSAAVVTEAAGSAVVFCLGDHNASDGASRVWLTINSITPTAGNGLEIVYDRQVSVNAAYVAYWNDVGTAASKTAGLSTPSMRYGAVALEIKAVAGPTFDPKQASQFLTFF